MCSSKKGISAHQVHRTLNITYKSAWFMCHRIREAMKAGGVVPPPLGGKGKHVEADETFIGRKAGAVMGRGGVAHKRTVLSLVERGGEVRSFHIDRATVSEIVPHMAKHLDIESTLNTDEAKRFVGIGRTFKGGHQAVDHSVKEYARDTAHTNTLEGYFSIFKKGMRGVYQHCDERHLHRYLAEFDFRYSNRAKLGVDDNARTRKVLRGISCKCLTYVQAH